MKKLALLSAITLLTFLPLGVQAQNTDSAAHHNSDTRKTSKKPTSLSGEIGNDGKTLRADRDFRIWRVSNPEIFGGIDARHAYVPEVFVFG